MIESVILYLGGFSFIASCILFWQNLKLRDENQFLSDRYKEYYSKLQDCQDMEIMRSSYIKASQFDNDGMVVEHEKETF